MGLGLVRVGLELGRFGWYWVGIGWVGLGVWLGGVVEVVNLAASIVLLLQKKMCVLVYSASWEICSQQLGSCTAMEWPMDMNG